MGYRERKQTDNEWTILFTPEEVDRLLREQAESYLKQFAKSEANPHAPYHHHDGGGF